jgi:chromosome segregation ATPase
MQYFLVCESNARNLAKDTAEYRFQIRQKNSDIALYRENAEDLKSQITNGNTMLNNSKSELTDVRLKLNKAENKIKVRNGIIIGSVSVNLLFITIVAIKVL